MVALTHIQARAGMHRGVTSDVTIPASVVDSLLAGLNASGAVPRTVEDWTARWRIDADRVIEGPDITYVRLVGRAEQGGPIVLMHVEGVWERAMKHSPADTSTASEPAHIVREPVSLADRRSQASGSRATPAARVVLRKLRVAAR
ncbi:MAG: hypothetical protein ACQEWM_06070 [Actinomycetota bacterium]